MLKRSMDTLMDTLIDTLTVNGVVKIENVYSTMDITNLKKLYHESWNSVKKNWPDTWYYRKYLPMNIKYDNFMGTDLYNGRKIAYLDDTMIIDMGNNRFDFTYKMDSLNQSPLPDIIRNLLDSLLGPDYHYYWGGLPVESGIGSDNGQNGKWHRDAYSLFNNETLDLELPPFYYTILIPLDDYLGGTEFISGSHKINLSQNNITDGDKLLEWADQMSITRKINPILHSGDVIIFNGYTIHRGLHVPGNKLRDMMYIVAKKTWYNDEPSENYIEHIITNG